MLRISWSPNDCSAANDNRKTVDTTCLFDDYWIRKCYWEYLRDPRRCGLLYNERAKCYTRIINCWLLFLEAPPDLEGSGSLDHKICRKIVLATWSRILSKCVPGNKDLICRLRDFTLNNACKKDVEHVIRWLEVSLQGYHSFISYIHLCGVLQMDSNIPNNVLVRWKTYSVERYPPPHEAAPVQTMAMGTYVFGGIMMAAVMSSIPKPIWDRLFRINSV